MNSIIIITNNFPPIIDGVGDYSYNLFTHLKRETDYSAFIICSNKQKIKEYIQKENLEDQVFPIVEKWNIADFIRIVRKIKSMKSKNVILQYVPYSFSKKGIPFSIICLYIILWLRGIKISTFFHEIAVNRVNQPIHLKLLSFTQRSIAWCIAFLSHKKLTNSIFHQAYLKPFKSTVIPVGTNMVSEEFAPAENVSIENNSISIFSFSNRINKAIVEGVSKYQHISQKNISWTIAGSAPESRLQWLKSNLPINQNGFCINIVGTIETNVLQNIVENIQLILHAEPEATEGVGGISTKNGSIISAMALGKCIVGSKGLQTDTNYFKHLENVFLVSTNNSNEWFDALTTLVNSPSLVTKLSQESYNTYKTFFKWNIITEKYLNVLSGKSGF